MYAVFTEEFLEAKADVDGVCEEEINVMVDVVVEVVFGRTFVLFDFSGDIAENETEGTGEREGIPRRLFSVFITKIDGTAFIAFFVSFELFEFEFKIDTFLTFVENKFLFIAADTLISLIECSSFLFLFLSSS